MIKTILSPFDHYPLQLELGEDFLPSQNPNLKLKQNHSRLPARNRLRTKRERRSLLN